MFVTGTLAEPALRQIMAEIEAAGEVQATIVVLNIQVAALMTTDWLSRKLVLPANQPFDRVILPGYCRGDVQVLTDKLGVNVELGPANLHDLPGMFGRQSKAREGYGQYNIQIIAEINDAARLPVQTILAMAEAYRQDGADIIDLGCDPQSDRPAWAGVADVVKQLRDLGLRVSIDSFHREEVAQACKAGAELVLSVNSTNCRHARDWGATVIAIPDDPHTLENLDTTIEQLEKDRVPYQIDPVIEPIGFGFAQSLTRYAQVRQRYPQAAMMMGIGNLTEMTEADSAGVNMLLIGVCQELNITSVLTTQVINWARSSVREIDLARRVMHYAVTQRVPPKHVDERLVMLRDPKLRSFTHDELSELARRLTDTNIRLFADAKTNTLHAMNKDVHATSDDPFVLFDQLNIHEPSHAFYLGYELAKAMAALTLGKNYTQDEPLNWGMLTRREISHYENRQRQKKKES